MMPSRRELLGGLSGVALIGTAGCLESSESQFSPGSDTTTDWPMPRHDPHNTAFTPDAVAPRTDVRERWATDIGSDISTPAIADGIVFAPDAEGLLALDGDSGEELWQFAPTQHPWPSPPAVHDGIVYVTTSDDDTVFAVDADTGDKLWSLTGAGHIHSPPHPITGRLVSEPFVLVANDDGTVRALDPANGDEHWQIDVFGAVRTMAFRSPRLYIGTVGGEVYAYSLNGTGEEPGERWRRKVGSQIEGIVPTDNGIVVSTFSGPLQNLQDGANAGINDWIATESHTGSPPVHAGSWVYSTGWDSLSSLRVYDKNRHWQVSADFDNAAPVAAGDTIYAPVKGDVHAFDLSGGVGVGGIRVGATRWTHTIESGGIQGLAVGDGALFVACESHNEDDSTLVCLEPP